jgi:hypothetical protein
LTRTCWLSTRPRSRQRSVRLCPTTTTTTSERRRTRQLGRARREWIRTVNARYERIRRI